ncbi:Yip1 family protein [Halorarum halobium]|uniref:Yip1 family protein n=1 Tax=Halorarum halobium TaxID=3075121 RepID=UPI0028B052F1|nr:Yip1 family protein [Halobaculum sp. XH14]
MSGPRTPLLRPGSYFESHDGSPPVADAAIAVAVVAALTAGGVGLFLGEFAASVDATVEMDNPEHRPEWACENYENMDVSTPSGCGSSVPETVDRDLGTLVAEELSWLPWATLFVVPVFWLFQAGVLHALTAMAGGEGSFAGTLSVAGWGMVPSIARLLGVGAVILYQLRTTPVPGSPEGAVAALEAALAGLGTISIGAALVVAVWGGYVRTYGLASARDVSFDEALIIVAATTLVGLGFELV